MKSKRGMKRFLTTAEASVGLLLAIVFLFAASTNLKAGPAAQEKDKYEVVIDNFSFGPAELTVPTGTKVTWVNRDDVPHTVVSTEGKFKSQALDTDEKFSFVFNDPGTYEYYCSLHPKMTAKVIVK
jgi:plastocyanin